MTKLRDLTLCKNVEPQSFMTIDGGKTYEHQAGQFTLQPGKYSVSINDPKHKYTYIEIIKIASIWKVPKHMMVHKWKHKILKFLKIGPYEVKKDD